MQWKSSSSQINFEDPNNHQVQSVLPKYFKTHTPPSIPITNNDHVQNTMEVLPGLLQSFYFQNPLVHWNRPENKGRTRNVEGWVYGRRSKNFLPRSQGRSMVRAAKLRPGPSYIWKQPSVLGFSNLWVSRWLSCQDYLPVVLSLHSHPYLRYILSTEPKIK